MCLPATGDESLIVFFSFLFIVTSTRKRSRSNAPIAVKVSANHGRWPSIAFCTWKSRHTSAPFALAASTSDRTSRPIYWRTRTSNLTSAHRAAKCSGAIAICAATPWLTPSVMWGRRARATTLHSIRPDCNRRSSSNHRTADCPWSIPIVRRIWRPVPVALNLPWITWTRPRIRPILAILSSQSHRHRCRHLLLPRYCARRKQRLLRPLPPPLPKNRPSTSTRKLCAYLLNHLHL